MAETTSLGPISAFLQTIGHLPRKMRRMTWMFLPALLVAAGVETLFAGAAALFVSTISNPEAAAQSSVVLTIARIVGELQPVEPKVLVCFAAGLLVVLIILKNVITAFNNYAIGWFSIRIEEAFGHRLLGGFLSLPYEWHLNRNSADLVLAVQWANLMGNKLVFPVLKLLGDSFIIAFMLIAIFIVEPFTSLVVFAVLGCLSVLAFRWVQRTLDRIATSCRDIRLDVNRDTTKAIHGIKDVHISGKADSFAGSYTSLMRPLSRLVGKRIMFTQLPFNLVESLGVLAICGFVVLAFLYTDDSGTRITGTVILLAVTAWRVLPAMGRVLSEFAKIRSHLPFIATELEYVREMPPLSDSPKHHDLGNLDFRESVQFSDVSFRYQEAHVDSISQLSMSLERGVTLGVVGTSGAGKSTFVDLFIGLLRPSSGHILVDGSPLDEESATSWMRNVGYVPQSPYICDGTLAENVAFGISADQLDRDKVLSCCDMAAIDFLEDLAQGMDTPIGERGTKLSGGQRQRVAIARALYNDPDVMIFDEATSALDQASEQAIWRTIYSLKGKKTLVIIAHRMSSVEDCDRVVWIEQGQLKMEGSSSDVLECYRQTHVNSEQTARRNG